MNDIYLVKVEVEFFNNAGGKVTYLFERYEAGSNPSNANASVIRQAFVEIAPSDNLVLDSVTTTELELIATI